jgi:hypothetical protein
MDCEAASPARLFKENHFFDGAIDVFNAIATIPCSDDIPTNAQSSHGVFLAFHQDPEQSLFQKTFAYLLRTVLSTELPCESVRGVALCRTLLYNYSSSKCDRGIDGLFGEVWRKEAPATSGFLFPVT